MFSLFRRALLQFLVTGLMISGVSSVLPAYSPAILRNGFQDHSLQELIQDYFVQGFTNSEILGFLSFVHGISLAMRTLKRWLKRMGLKRAKRTNEAPLEDIVFAIIVEMERFVGSFVGYREMTRRLRVRHNLNIRRDKVTQAMREIDPEGAENRRRRRLQRRRYRSPGPNFIWHLDGWDKLKPYGFCVHGCVDGFSRRILWLEVNVTNKNPNVMLHHFLCTVQQLEGVPRLLRTDLGTENVWISAIQKLLRRNGTDSLAGEKSVIQGKSSANQRIEAYWSKLRCGGGGWWINFFKDLRDSGIYKDHDAFHRECLKFFFMPVLRKELYSVAQLWNIKAIQVKKNADVAGGKPHLMFFVPEAYSTKNYLENIDKDEVELCKAMYAEKSRDASLEVEEVVNYIVPDYRVPENTDQALQLFLEITSRLENLGY